MEFKAKSIFHHLCNTGNTFEIILVYACAFNSTEIDSTKSNSREINSTELYQDMDVYFSKGKQFEIL